jgi:hypothetical protein
MNCLRSLAIFAMRSYRCAIASRSSLAHVVESLFATRRASSARSRQKPSSMSGAFATGFVPLIIAMIRHLSPHPSGGHDAASAVTEI